MVIVMFTISRYRRIYKIFPPTAKFYERKAINPRLDRVLEIFWCPTCKYYFYDYMIFLLYMKKVVLFKGRNTIKDEELWKKIESKCPYCRFPQKQELITAYMNMEECE